MALKLENERLKMSSIFGRFQKPSDCMLYESKRLETTGNDDEDGVWVRYQTGVGNGGLS
jgi:hypothetical protein